MATVLGLKSAVIRTSSMYSEKDSGLSYVMVYRLSLRSDQLSLKWRFWISVLPSPTAKLPLSSSIAYPDFSLARNESILPYIRLPLNLSRLAVALKQTSTSS